MGDGAELEIGCDVVGDERGAYDGGEDEGVDDAHRALFTVEERLDGETPDDEAGEQDAVGAKAAGEHEREGRCEPLRPSTVQHACWGSY